MAQLVTKQERTAAFIEVFGAAQEANAKVGKKIKHKVTGEDVYEKQIRVGKTKRDHKA